MDLQRTALSLTATVAILYVLCSIIYAVLPGPAGGVAQAVFHGMLASGAPALTLGSFFIGLVTTCAIAYITAAVFAWCYNMGAKPRA